MPRNNCAHHTFLCGNCTFAFNCDDWLCARGSIHKNDDRLLRIIVVVNAYLWIYWHFSASNLSSSSVEYVGSRLNIDLPNCFSVLLKVGKLVIIRDVFDVFCCFITGICMFFGWSPTKDMLTTSYSFEIHNKAAWYSPNSSRLASDQYHHEIEAKCVSQSKMAAKAWNDLASAINTRGTS